MPTCADAYVLGPSCCTYGLRVVASCVLYARRTRTSLGRAESTTCRTYRGTPGADRPAPSPTDCAVREKLTTAFDQLPREYIDLAPAFTRWNNELHRAEVWPAQN